MKIEQIDGIKFENHGVNDYSHNMEAIIFNPEHISIDKIKDLKGVFLHPTQEPNSMEIYALKGLKDNFDLFCENHIRSHCMRTSMSIYGTSFYNHKVNCLRNELIEKLITDFIPWYNLETHYTA